MNFEEKTLDYEYVYKGKVIDVRRDNVEISTGRKSVREVVEHSGGVVIAAQKSPDTVLMVKQFRYPIKETVLELPAGKLEKGEEPFPAAKRELEEETGYRAKIWKTAADKGLRDGIRPLHKKEFETCKRKYRWEGR